MSSDTFAQGMTLNMLYRVLSIYGLVAGVICFALFPGDPQWMLFACGQLAYPALLGLPSLMSRPIRLSDPLNLVVISMTIGTVIGSYMLAFGTGVRRNFLMADWDVPDYAVGAFWMLLSIMLISIGYSMTTRRLKIERLLPRAGNISETGLQIGIVAGGIISLIAIASFLQSSGGFSLSTLGSKRAVEITDGGEVVYAAAGYTRLLASVTGSLLLMLLGYYLWRYPRLTWGVLFKLTLVFALSAVMPIVTSGRGAMMQLAIGLIFVISAYRQIKVRHLVTVAVIGLIVFSTMTTLRSIAQGASDGDSHSANPIVKLAESGNGLAIASTTAVINGVPDRMPFQLGSTMTSWIFAPIPRSVWPAKPEISLGKRIKAEIYQLGVIKTGRPASLMAEGYMNFGWIGFFGLSLLFGILLRLVANSFQPVLSLSPFAPALYFIVASGAAGLVNSNISQAIVRFLTEVVTFVLAWILIRYIVARRPVSRRNAPLPAE